MSKIRLNKFLADCGVSSRRKADDLIKSGRVKVNSLVIKKLGVVIDTRVDKVAFDNKGVQLANKVIFAFYKPVGVVSTVSDPYAKKTIADFFSKELGRIYPVGRLDKDSEGLILVTNNGDLANKLTHPRYLHEKEYEVVIEGKGDTRRFTKRFVLDGYRIKPMKLSKVKKVSNNQWRINLTLQEGRKRQIRAVAKLLGYTVKNIKRIRIGKFKLDKLKPGKYIPIEVKQIV